MGSEFDGGTLTFGSESDGVIGVESDGEVLPVGVKSDGATVPELGRESVADPASPSSIELLYKRTRMRAGEPSLCGGLRHSQL